MSEAIVRAICAEFNIGIVPRNEYPKPGQTRALATMGRILGTHGEGHLRLVLSTLAETKGNEGLINEVSLWAVSDLILACSEWVENHASEWFEAWDAIPMGWLMWRCQELVPVVKQRHALVGMMYLMLTSRRERNIAGDRQPGYSFLRRIMKAEEEPSAADVRRQQMVAAGQKLLEVKAALPRASFLQWVEAESGMHYETVKHYMRLAKAEADQQERSAA